MHDAELSVHGTLEEEGWESKPVFCEFGRKKEKIKAAARSWGASAATNSAAADDQGPRRDGARTKHIHTQIPCVSGVFRFAETSSSSELDGLAHFKQRVGRTRPESNIVYELESGNLY